MEIKIYTKGDDQAVVDLWQESLKGLAGIIDDRIDIKERLSTPSQFFFVASVGGHVVGTALAGICDNCAHLDHVAVKPDYRRKGVGRALIEEAESRLLESGCDSLNIEVDAANETALSFLRTLGYKLEGIVGLGKSLTQSNNGS